ncbi:MAG: SDR family oxidoreductase [Candidatus Rokubacteria bacterium]|nr:SDR family oxidoreductase [Candidatus Rokubacteria bacterium]
MLVNNAGIGGRELPVHELGAEDWARLGACCAANAGLVQLTRVMALELARHGVQMNCVCPGYFATPMSTDFFASRAGQEVIQRSIPMRRLGEPAELAPAVVLLASDGASFMTGSVLVVDGGHMLT